MQWIYDHNEDNSARYTLGVEGEPKLVCFGINPSTARPGALDNTLKSVERIATRHGKGGWLMLNIYPQRATNPNDMHNVMDEGLHRENLRYIAQYLKGNKNKPVQVLAAWGTLIYKRPYLAHCLRDIYEVLQPYRAEWLSIGKHSKDGHPHHPLYLSNAEALQLFDMEAYISRALLK